ncbi:hypothetical protein D0817_16760 [Flavobacterium cupreum]|uniref:Uncharacterized protein n=1 Tax=Flavobacterium cupreum TaxID=2133766 RepID=A0A434A496_9FLAO|nr:hypothetical protein [Flavobacterium cupreum]RUT69162.1 hypothetical protein D0817_16760 [Flavobacterium cupreum]
MKDIDKVQNLLPLGYLFLVILGIAKESIIYYQIGINIITYSSVMDILISPIAAITSHPVFFITVLVFVIFYFKLPEILLRNEDKKWLHKSFGVATIEPGLSKDERLDYYTIVAIKSLGVFLVCVFLGYGFADGRAISEKIKNNSLKYNYQLNYTDNKSENVYLIGSNTGYFFYLAKGNPAIKIAPVGAVKNIELTQNRMLNK